MWCLQSFGRWKNKIVCADGPEFDAHQVDFDEMLMRLGGYKEIEQEDMKKIKSRIWEQQ